MEGVGLDRIWAAMRWYAENHGEQGQYSLIIECGHSFREKFPRLEKAMERDKGIKSTNQQETDADLDVGTIGRNYIGLEQKDATDDE